MCPFPHAPLLRVLPPPQVLMATLKDEYRKPDTGMWDFFVQHMNAGAQPDIRQGLHRCHRCLAAV